MRSFSTFGTLVVLLGQALMLWLVQVWIEPSRRERMVSRIIEETGKIVENHHANNASAASLELNLAVDEPKVRAADEMDDDSVSLKTDDSVNLLDSSIWTMEFWKRLAWKTLHFFQRSDVPLWKGILMGSSAVTLISLLF